jgi:hypothetical protein
VPQQNLVSCFFESSLEGQFRRRTENLPEKHCSRRSAFQHHYLLPSMDGDDERLLIIVKFGSSA